MKLLIASMYVFYMSVISRAHGADTGNDAGYPTGWPSWGRLVASVSFAASAAAASYALLGVWFISLLMAALTWLSYNTGHGRFFMMQGANTADPNPEFIEKYIVLPFYSGAVNKPLYSWVCMGVKGLGVGLAAFPFGLSLTFLWPFSYYVSTRFTSGQDKTAAAEWLTGFFTGLVFVAAYFLG